MHLVKKKVDFGLQVHYIAFLVVKGDFIYENGYIFHLNFKNSVLIYLINNAE
ncbi:hypothetical protein HMPREF0240_04013 [Clostridium sp. D5]|nr:hypothetical protein HMPREF0240_04012 [Clostridium sp. D5]EGB90978.1 hypothetical protein HMPREF0240_04013 [Clostridium sp. D5]